MWSGNHDQGGLLGSTALREKVNTLLARRLPYKALDGRLQMARAPRLDAGSGMGQVRAWGEGRSALDLGGAGDTVWQGERDRVQPWGFLWVLRRRDGPGGVSASGELPGALPQEERCSGTPDPRGKPTCTERPGQRSRETARAGRIPAKGFRAHRTADGGCRGSKVNLLRPELATRSLGSLSRAPQH